jgi:hypothetical protein
MVKIGKLPPKKEDGCFRKVSGKPKTAIKKEVRDEYI